jgi:hypothetical protein
MATPNTPQAPSLGGVSRLRATIIACVTGDMGCCLMCADCGHLFMESKPLSGESQPRDNSTLAKELWRHICAIDTRPDGKGARHAR